MMRVPPGGARPGGNVLDVIETVFQRCRIVPRFAVSRIPDGAQRPRGVDEPFGRERGFGGGATILRKNLKQAGIAGDAGRSSAEAGWSRRRYKDSLYVVGFEPGQSLQAVSCLRSCKYDMQHLTLEFTDRYDRPVGTLDREGRRWIAGTGHLAGGGAQPDSVGIGMNEIDEVPACVFVEYIAEGGPSPALPMRNPHKDIAVRMAVDVFSREVSGFSGEGLGSGAVAAALRTVTRGAIRQE